MVLGPGLDLEAQVLGLGLGVEAQVLGPVLDVLRRPWYHRLVLHTSMGLKWAKVKVTGNGNAKTVFVHLRKKLIDLHQEELSIFSPYSRDVVFCLGPWSLVVLKDKIMWSLVLALAFGVKSLLTSL